jgi:hypothetical protein
LINLAERIGGNIFDPAISQYINKNSLEVQNAGFDFVKEYFGVPKPSNHT